MANTSTKKDKNKDTGTPTSTSNNTGSTKPGLPIRTLNNNSTVTVVNSMPPEDDKDVNCVSCKVAFSSDCDSIECFCCKGWLHLQCSNVSKTAFNNVSNNDHLQYICINCLNGPSDVIKSDLLKDKETISKIDNLSREVQALKISISQSIEEHKKISINKLSEAIFKENLSKQLPVANSYASMVKTVQQGNFKRDSQKTCNTNDNKIIA